MVDKHKKILLSTLSSSAYNLLEVKKNIWAWKLLFSFTRPTLHWTDGAQNPAAEAIAKAGAEPRVPYSNGNHCIAVMFLSRFLQLLVLHVV